MKHDVRCVIVQPSYIPWRGYFDLIRRADVFVFYDDVQYDKHGWRNRNRIKTANGVRWLTIPVQGRGNIEKQLLIKDIEMVPDSGWSRKHLATLTLAYKKAPFYERYELLLNRIYSDPPRRLAEFTIEVSQVIAAELGIKGVRYLRSSELGVDGSRTERLVEIVKSVGATRYISGPTAAAYIDESIFEREGVALEYMRYDYPEYQQLYPPYDPAVSILDLMFMVGPNVMDYFGEIDRTSS